MLKIILPVEFTKAEQVEVLRWREDVRGARLDWPTLVRAFNRLRKAILVIPNRGRRTFAGLYANLIDRHLTDPFIHALYGLTNVQKESIPLWAKGARQVQPLFNLPQPMRIVLQSGEFVVTDYEIWKEKIRIYQREEQTKDATAKNA